MLLCVCVQMFMHWNAYGGQRTAGWSWFCSFTLWVLGVELRLMHQAALSAELFHRPVKDILKSLGSNQQLKLIKRVVVLERLVYRGGGRSLFLILADPGEILQSLSLFSCSQ